MSEDVAAAGALAQTEMPGPPLTAQQRTYAASAAGRHSDVSGCVRVFAGLFPQPLTTIWPESRGVIGGFGGGEFGGGGLGDGGGGGLGGGGDGIGGGGGSGGGWQGSDDQTFSLS